MTTKISTIVLIAASILTSCKVKYPLPDAVMTPLQVSGTSECKPGNAGRILNFTKNPYSPGIKSTSSAKDIAFAVLGHTINKGDISGSDINTCSKTSSNPFTIDDVENVRFTEGRDIKYTRKEKLEINVEAAVEANLKELAKLNLEAAKIQDLKGKITAAYSRVNGKELTVEGRYSEWALSFDALSKLKKGDGYQECRAYIEDPKNPRRIITAVGLVYFDILFESSSIDKLAAELDAELKKEGISASLAFTFKREVSKSLKATSNGVFQILVWRHAGLNGDVLTSK